ncbi:hypothetical protein DCAR_0313909 [Daucus carota subsp. sativus]|uniref:X8 domain-containing protein n=1 Tax=Daucus carota subsp. sativus TaxID=79200 RepID=A0A166CAP8_DAUCS|nr:PREDICTED: glucan endo-1,3-beta-glucosidase 9 [Daucus carota subsp. sativus]WOG94613.1 hypothetical protein DCAR_0313909 [Daucus carota subsp. sativus]
MSLKLNYTISLLLFLNLGSSLFSTTAIGVNWGTSASHPLPPDKAVELLKANGITKIKLFDADASVLEALSGYNADVTLGIPNSMLHGLNSSFKAAQNWVHDNVTRFVSQGAGRLRIRYIAVGDEPFLQSYGNQFHPFVVGAATNIQAALFRAKLANEVRVVVPCSFDAFQSKSGLPSGGHFRSDINKTMIQLLGFLDKHHSPFFVTISPFLKYYQKENTSLDFALFRETAHPHNDSHKIYKNAFDLSYDTVVSALSAARFPQIDIVIGQIGWPTDGFANATSSIAEEFMKGLIGHLNSKSGSPLRPHNPPIETYILSLLDENQRSIATGNFERHWGIFTFDGQAKYHVDFGRGSKKMVDAENVEYLSTRWCVVNNNKDLSNVTAKASEACLLADCSALSPGGSCFNISYPGNISYAFNSYYQQQGQRFDSCDFGGLGLITTVNPSMENCRFSVEISTSISVSRRILYLFQWLIPLVVTILFCL